MNTRYDAEAEAFVNRSYCSAVGINPRNKPMEDSQLCKLLWEEAISSMDMGGSGDVVFDAYLPIDPIYKVIIADELPHHPEMNKHPLWEAHDKAFAMAENFETRAYISALVASALMVIEGYANTIWAEQKLMDAWDNEFKPDRAQIDVQIRRLFQFAIDENPDDTANQKVAAILAKDNETLAAEKKAARDALFASDN